MKILVINAGSSSLKYQFIDIEKKEVLAKGICERIGIEGSKISQKADGKPEYELVKDMKDHSDAIKMVIDALTSKEYGVISSMSEIDAVGHRVLHGGKYYSASTIVTEDVKKVIRDCFDLGPLHNPANLTGIEACEKAMPGTPQVAVFDTAFGQSMDKKVYTYAIPYEYYEKYAIRRYGFHGISHNFVANRALEVIGLDKEKGKVIVCHLGNGSSLTAVRNGKSVATSMGFTPLAGTVMGTRCGSIDPAIVKFIADTKGMSLAEVDNLLNKESGVYGISGVSSDFRDLDAAASEGNERAKLALDMFVYSVRKYIGQYIVQMGGVDVIVFTAGVGENDGKMREAITNNLEFLGISLDKEKNAKIRGKEEIVSTPDSKVKVVVVPTNEELMIARDTKELLA